MVGSIQKSAGQSVVSKIYPYNSIKSGKTKTTSNQPAFLKPDGTVAKFKIEGTATPLVLDINGQQSTWPADVETAALSVAPATNNTCLVNDAKAIDQESTRVWGEYGEKNLNIGTIQSEIVSQNGTFQAFKINNGSDDEYFLAYVDTVNNTLSRAYRGFFYNSAYVGGKRIKFADGDTITLLKTHYAFCVNDGATILTTTNEPIESGTEPASPATGDFWLDTSIPDQKKWKVYGGAAYADANATFVGWAVFDSSGCVVGRSYDFYKEFKEDNNIEIDLKSVTEMITKTVASRINVYGTEISFQSTAPVVSIATDLAAAVDMYNATEQASTKYYWYISDQNKLYLSDISPHFRPDLLGYYFPHHTWRCCGFAFNDSASDFLLPYYSGYNSLATISEMFIELDTYLSQPTGWRYVNMKLHGEYLADVVNDASIGFRGYPTKRCNISVTHSQSCSPSHNSYMYIGSFVWFNNQVTSQPANTCCDVRIGFDDDFYVTGTGTPLVSYFNTTYLLKEINASSDFDI
jgi:hypothetical protein